MKEDGWWLVLGDEATQELYAIKRTSFGERATARLSYTASSADEVANLQLQLVSALNLSHLESGCVSQPQLCKHKHPFQCYLSTYAALCMTSGLAETGVGISCISIFAGGCLPARESVSPPCFR